MLQFSTLYKKKSFIYKQIVSLFEGKCRNRFRLSILFSEPLGKELLRTREEFAEPQEVFKTKPNVKVDSIDGDRAI